MKKTVITNSPEETLALGVELGKKAGAGDIIGLWGGLGSGKTVIAKGIAKGLGISDEVTSPTFTLLDIYEGRLPLYHFDLYRISGERELDLLCFEEFWYGEGVSVIEWPEHAGPRLEKDAVKISIEYLNDTARRITIEHPDH